MFQFDLYKRVHLSPEMGNMMIEDLGELHWESSAGSKKRWCAKLSSPPLKLTLT